MSRMSATFQFEGNSQHSVAGEVGMVSVTIETDGQFVGIVERPELGHFWLPALTLKGWAALSLKANALMARANDQWAAMGAER